MQTRLPKSEEENQGFGGRRLKTKCSFAASSTTFVALQVNRGRHLADPPINKEGMGPFPILLYQFRSPGDEERTQPRSHTGTKVHPLSSLVPSFSSLHEPAIQCHATTPADPGRATRSDGANMDSPFPSCISYSPCSLRHPQRINGC